MAIVKLQEHWCNVRIYHVKINFTVMSC